MQRFNSVKIEAIVTFIFCGILVIANHLLPADDKAKSQPIAKQAPQDSVKKPSRPHPSVVAYPSQTIEYRQMMVRQNTQRPAPENTLLKQNARKPQSFVKAAQIAKVKGINAKRIAKDKFALKRGAVAFNRSKKSQALNRMAAAHAPRIRRVAAETEFERLVRKPDLEEYVKRDLNAELKQLQISRAQYKQLVIKRNKLAQNLKRDEVKSSPHLRRMLLNDYRAWVREQLGENGYERYAEWSGGKFVKE